MYVKWLNDVYAHILAIFIWQGESNPGEELLQSQVRLSSEIVREAIGDHHKDVVGQDLKW